MRAIKLRTNYRINPMGIDDTTPLLTWKCEDGIRQQAYRVEAFDEENRKIFDSGRVESDSMKCRFQGEQLQSGQRIRWQVTLWENEKKECSESAWFEMGLLKAADRTAKWICGVDTNQKERLPADYYRKTFDLTKKVKKARLYATACGVYCISVNGQRLPGVLAPGTSEYTKRLYYQTYDVTGYLKKQNTLDFTLGDGWYKGKLGWLDQSCRFGKQTKLWAQLVITYEDGSAESIGTDEAFRWCNDGPIRYTDMKDGEVYDARMNPGYGDYAQVTNHSVIPLAACADGIYEQEVFLPKLIVTKSGAKILDFGQNLAGYIRFRIKGEEGQTVVLSMTECLENGEFCDMTLRKNPEKPADIQKIVYTCNGKESFFSPEFFYSGFRYALVEGMEHVEPADFEGVAVYSRLEFTGTFSCSNEKINQFYQNTIWSLKSNFIDIPTDCPQREKSGWDGDAQVFCKTASYITDDMAFFGKWLKDLRDCQRKDGRVANVSPSAHPYQDREPLSGAAGWADAAIIVPYTLWKLYGDDQILFDNYELMKGWKEYVIKAAKKKTLKRLSVFPPANKMFRPYYVPRSPLEKYVIECGMHWGEWLEPDIDSISEQRQPKPELTAAYTHYSMRLLSEMLEAMGKEEEAIICSDFAKGAKEAYNYYFVKDGRVLAPRQAPMVRALALGLLEEEDALKVAGQLNESAINRNYTVGTGFLSTPFVLGVLAKYGYLDTAYRMLENTKAPGWLAMVEQGATTVWEVYEIFDDNGRPKASSMNHYSPGAVCSFLFDTVCGIMVTGENRFDIIPRPGGTLRYAGCSYDSPYGKVESSWEKMGKYMIFQISIPANTTARVCLPNGDSGVYQAGNYTFEVKG